MNQPSGVSDNPVILEPSQCGCCVIVNGISYTITEFLAGPDPVRNPELASLPANEWRDIVAILEAYQWDCRKTVANN